MPTLKWHLENLPWKEKISFLFRYVLDPWVFACWVILFVVGMVASNIYWNVFTNSGVSIIFSNFAVPWFFSPEIAEDQSGQIEKFLYLNIYTTVKIFIYGGLLLTFIKIRPEKRIRRCNSYVILFIVFFIVWLLERSSFLLLEDQSCADSDGLIFSPHFTPLGFAIPFIYSWVVAPLWEEITFRGLMFNWLQHRSAIFKIILTSMLFVYMHLVGTTGFVIPTVTSIFGSFAERIFFSWLPMGLLFGYAREKTGGILVPFILHSATNILIDIEAVLLLASGLCPAS